MFLALHDLRRSWRRFSLVGAVVALVALLATVLTALADGLVQQGTSGLRALPFDHIAFAPRSGAVFSRSTLDARALAVWRGVPGVEASPLGLSFVAAAPVRRGPSLDLAVVGVPAGSFLVQRPDARRALAAGDGIVLSSETETKGVAIGDRYRLGGSRRLLPVLGFTYAGSYGHVPIAFVSLRTWQSLAYGASTAGRFSAVALRLPAGVDVTAVDRHAGTETDTKAQAYGGSPGFTQETATMTLIRGFLLAVSALIVGAFFTVLVLQRTRQIGLLKALGASTTYVLRDALGQMALVVAVATAAGAILGAILVHLLEGSSVPVVLSAVGIVRSAALLALAGLLGSLVAVRRVAVVEPAVALGAEP